MTRGTSATLPTELPSRYERLFAWRLDRRCKAVRDVAADLFELWQDLGGVDSLSTQKRWLCERVVYLRRRCLDYEAAVLHNANREPAEPERPLPMDAGTYSNHANVLQGYLKTLGLSRQAKRGPTLREYMTGAVEESGSEPPSDPGHTDAAGEQIAAPEPSNAATEGTS
ncbi:MAG: hypothetical protein ACYDAE_00315 [Steroidobacteraceae bacterium]